MKKFSNKYIFVYITVLVSVVAILLAIVSEFLKPMQQANRERERVMQVLASAGFTEPANHALAFYKKVAEDKILSDTTRVIQITRYDGQVSYVIRLDGKGLWGPIWGYVCIAQDGNTVEGAIFDHKSETPGLGAEIAKDNFCQSFKGKLLFDENGNFVSVRVLKGGTANHNINPLHGVDAITGGTITSKGVDKMLHDGLQKYVPFLQSLHHRNK
ncbi:MAG: NADH:ubiquinone reductase (Na(+)-transporting) subunit C [Bacteroidales bacterium]|nr:NADH:ubiquinone reductase (Na(+)-transporting) subunit C [Bacteroidales bacterium]